MPTGLGLQTEQSSGFFLLRGPAFLPRHRLWLVLANHLGDRRTFLASTPGRWAFFANHHCARMDVFFADRARRREVLADHLSRGGAFLARPSHRGRMILAEKMRGMLAKQVRRVLADKMGRVLLAEHQRGPDGLFAEGHCRNRG